MRLLRSKQLYLDKLKSNGVLGLSLIDAFAPIEMDVLKMGIFGSSKSFVCGIVGWYEKVVL